MAAYGKRGQHWTFYEINPIVERIARNPKFFTYLTDCWAKVDVADGRCRRDVSQAVCWKDLVAKPVRVDVPVYPPEQPLHAQPGCRDRPGEVVGKGDPVAVDADHSPYQADAVLLEGGEVERASVRPPDQLCGRLPPGQLAVAHLVDRRVEQAEAIEPPVDVHPAVAARHPGVAADGDRHVAPCGLQLVGELHAGRRGSDDQHAAVRQ